jgi:hypothetical protein
VKTRLTHPDLRRLENEIVRMYKGLSVYDVTTLSPEMLEEYRTCNDALRMLRAQLESLGPNPAFKAEMAMAAKLAGDIAVLDS